MTSVLGEGSKAVIDSDDQYEVRIRYAADSIIVTRTYFILLRSSTIRMLRIHPTVCCQRYVANKTYCTRVDVDIITSEIGSFRTYPQ